MKAGRELDRIVVENVMMWEFWDCKEIFAGTYPMYLIGKTSKRVIYCPEPMAEVIFAPSTNIADTMMMLDKFEWYSIEKINSKYHVWIKCDDGSKVLNTSKTLGEAACLAAIRAVSDE